MLTNVARYNKYIDIIKNFSFIKHLSILGPEPEPELSGSKKMRTRTGTGFNRFHILGTGTNHISSGSKGRHPVFMLIPTQHGQACEKFSIDCSQHNIMGNL